MQKNMVRIPSVLNVFCQPLAGACGKLFMGDDFRGNGGGRDFWKRFRIVPHTSRLHMAAAVVVCMHSFRGILVESTPQLAMGENSGDRICVEHATRGERYSGIRYIQ